MPNSDLLPSLPFKINENSPGSGWTRPRRKNAPNRWRCTKVNRQRRSSGSRLTRPWGTSGIKAPT